jgi:REP element-mobilizing transposase RayT
MRGRFLGADERARAQMCLGAGKCLGAGELAPRKRRVQQSMRFTTPFFVVQPRTSSTLEYLSGMYMNCTLGVPHALEGPRVKSTKISEKMIAFDISMCYENCMARPRKRHIQQSLRFPDKNGQNRGRRKGEHWRGRKPGRPPKGSRAGSPHKTRPTLEARFPVHVVLRAHRDVSNLRKRHIYKALREATIAVAKRELNFKIDGAFRIVHISIQSNHVHLLVEAGHKTALSRGMQSFQISAAKHINREYTVREGLAVRRRGSVFPDRFHQEIITTPLQARNALSYVLNNWRKHREDRTQMSKSWKVDPYSTGVLFTGWKEHADRQLMWKWRDTYDPLVVYLPKTWLLRESWLKYGRISYYAVPSARPIAAN